MLFLESWTLLHIGEFQIFILALICELSGPEKKSYRGNSEGILAVFVKLLQITLK